MFNIQTPATKIQCKIDVKNYRYCQLIYYKTQSVQILYKQQYMKPKLSNKINVVTDCKLLTEEIIKDQESFVSNKMYKRDKKLLKQIFFLNKPTVSMDKVDQKEINMNKFKREWTSKETEKLFSYYDQYGHQWCIIEHFFQKRTQNMLKNKFYGTIKRLLKLIFENDKVSLQIIPNLKTTLLHEIYSGKRKFFKLKGCLSSLLHKMKYQFSNFSLELLSQIQRGKVQNFRNILSAKIKQIHYQKNQKISKKRNQENLRSQEVLQQVQPSQLLQIHQIPQVNQLSQVSQFLSLPQFPPLPQFPQAQVNYSFNMYPSIYPYINYLPQFDYPSFMPNNN